MSNELLFAVAVAVVVFLGVVSPRRSAQRFLRQARFVGMQNAVNRMILGMAQSHDNTAPLSEQTETLLTSMRNCSSRGDAYDEEMYLAHVNSLGEEIGEEAKTHGAALALVPPEGYAIVKMRLEELHTVMGLADVGFRRMLRHEGLCDDPIFETKEEAFSADGILEHFEDAYNPDHYVPPSGPPGRWMQVWKRFP